MSKPVQETDQVSVGKFAIGSIRFSDFAELPRELSGKSVLVADDDNFMCRLLKQLLENHLGLKVATVGNGRLAIAEALTGHYDVAMIDLVMPDTSGFDAIYAIRTMKPSLPIIAITGETMNSRIRRLRSRGVENILFKPFKITSLIQVIKGAFKAGMELPACR